MGGPYPRGSIWTHTCRLLQFFPGSEYAFDPLVGGHWGKKSGVLGPNELCLGFYCVYFVSVLVCGDGVFFS